MSDHAADDAVPEVDESRRKFLIAATAGTGAVGAVLTAVPFVASWNPSESARAAGLPIVACSILPYDTATPDQNARMHAINAWIHETALRTPGMASMQLLQLRDHISSNTTFPRSDARAVSPPSKRMTFRSTGSSCSCNRRILPSRTSFNPAFPTFLSRSRISRSPARSICAR